ncbi:hypothetical protein F891_01877 [Acinetobacter sp. CIP 101966]|uniref:Rha family transcriptional regulator n=1 Tax=Acinetobacter sp. CIP 101966 TaxID=1144662 RepID=UPI0002CFF2ED|nr:Rha family transcriptional regulator [Acinetobacter sp. CIP 101966]ENX26924.1 hypothetical protein F891_01877 [Acinetobacter sp. CIP 101966]
MNAKFNPVKLVDVKDAKPHTTTLQIALGLGLQHASVIKLVRTYRPDFAEFSPIRFEIRKGEALPQGGFAKATEYAVLDEQQATFLMTLLKNSPRVIAFKKALVKAFFEARTLLQTDYFALIQQREALNAKLECEKEIASACGKGLSTWKKQRDCLTTAIANVDRQIQPCLFE